MEREASGGSFSLYKLEKAQLGPPLLLTSCVTLGKLLNRPMAPSSPEK